MAGTISRVVGCFLGFALALGSAVGMTASSDDVVAVVNGTRIHRSDLARVRKDLPADVAGQMTAFRLADIAVTNKLVVDDAIRLGLDRDPEVKNAEAGARERALLHVWTQVKSRSRHTDAQLKAMYAETVAAYRGQEEVRAHHILVATEQEALSLIEELKNGADFEELAKSKSQDPTAKTNGGDLGFFTRTELVAEFTQVAFSLKPGQMTDRPVKTSYGWHVIRVDERHTAEPPSFDEVKDDLRQRDAQETLRQALDALRAKAKIEMLVETELPAPSP